MAQQGQNFPPPAAVEDDIPDPDEDDLDDLDDMLDDFSSMKVQPPKPAATTATTATPGAAAPGGSLGATASTANPNADLDALLGDDDFAKELAKNMASLFGGDTDVQAHLKDLLAEMDTDLDLSSATPEPSASASAPAQPSTLPPNPTPPVPTPESDATFQNRINETIRRLHESNRQATEASTSSAADPTEDFMAAMLKQLSDGAAAGGGGGAGDEDFSKLLLGMMEELTNKDILYEPMKELDDRFPRWMEENRGKVGAEDMRRYEEQRVIVKDIVARYDARGYSDANPADREYIVDKMQKMQAAGAPPPDLVGDMSSAADLLGLEEGCNPQ